MRPVPVLLQVCLFNVTPAPPCGFSQELLHTYKTWIKQDVCLMWHMKAVFKLRMTIYVQAMDQVVVAGYGYFKSKYFYCVMMILCCCKKSRRYQGDDDGDAKKQ